MVLKLRKISSKKGAIELSMSTIVILVLAMSMLVVGLILVQKIFFVAGRAIGEIDKGVRTSLSETFSKSDVKLAIHPSARTIEIKQRTQGQGFAFAVRNLDVGDANFEYEIEVDPSFDIQDKCEIKKAQADDWLLISSGSFTLGPGKVMENPKLVLFNIPDNAPPCTIPYLVNVEYGQGTRNGDHYTSDTLYLTVLPR